MPNLMLTTLVGALSLVAVAANALICGGVASPYDSFQARIIWIVPLLAAFATVNLLLMKSVSVRRVKTLNLRGRQL